VYPRLVTGNDDNVNTMSEVTRTERRSCQLPEALRHARVVAHLARGVGWPRGGWLLAGLSDTARRTLVADGYDIMEDVYGRVIVEPPAV